MPIVSTDIQYLLSGGTSNTDPNLSLGGVVSTTAITTAVKNNLFDDVTSAQSTSGVTEYRGFYMKNNHGSLTLQDARAFISSATTSADDEFDIGIAVEAVNVTMATIANEATAPTSVSFTRPGSYAAGLQLNGATGLTAGSLRGVWIRRTVNAGAAAATGDTGTVACQGDTAG